MTDKVPSHFRCAWRAQALGGSGTVMQPHANKSPICALLAAAAFTASCSGAPAPIRIGQFCTAAESDLSRLRAVLKQVASARHLIYEEGSSDLKNGRSWLGTPFISPLGTGETFSIQLYRGDGLGVGVSNTGMSDHEVGFAINAGSDKDEALYFSIYVSEQLGSYWKPADAPPGKGAKPSGQCQGRMEGPLLNDEA